MNQSRWSRDNLFLLVDLYEAYPVLYTLNHPDYHNRQRKEDAINDITMRLNKNVNKAYSNVEIKNKIQKLRTQYMENDNKVKSSTCSVAGVDDVYKPTWFLYDRLKFIKPHIIHRKSTSNLCISDVSRQSCSQLDPLEITEGENNVEITEGETDDLGTEIIFDDPITSPSTSGNIVTPSRQKRTLPGKIVRVPPVMHFSQLQKAFWNLCLHHQPSRMILIYFLNILLLKRNP